MTSAARLENDPDDDLVRYDDGSLSTVGADGV